MMNPITRTSTSILAVIAALGVAGSALAQPHRDEHKDERGNGRDEHANERDKHVPAVAAPGAGTVAEAPPAAGGVATAPPAGGVAVAPPVDAKLTERLHKMEEKRQRDRQVAVKDPKTWNDGRPQRATEHKSEIANAWGKTVSAPDAQSELKKHAERMARLNRILDIANDKGNTALAARVQTAIQTETDRDAQAMQAISAKAGAQ
jgi:hypothetical protein